LIDRLGGGSTWEEDEIDGLAERIDAQRRGRELLVRAARLPEGERAALELVDLAGLTPTEAARALGITAGAVRVRLFRARTRLRKDDH
jgi:RNA polymerase sigma factor (sigma-70 family)